MQAASRAVREAGKSLALVPTMGALHAGHLSLVRRAKQECDVAAASIFVNPAQFAPGEDYAGYPRAMERDAGLLTDEGVDILFAPATEEMYPNGFEATAKAGPVAATLEGAHRPGHFDGVVTVIAKLFDAVGPHRAYFGQKDAQQCAVIKQMVRDLNLPVEIVVCPTVREPGGLAMSSRNAYLNGEERTAATVLYRALCRAKELIESGERHSALLEAALRETLDTEPLAKTGYATVVDAETFSPIERLNTGAIAVLAVRIGKARLIDNLPVPVIGGQPVPRF